MRELNESDLDSGELLDVDEFVGMCITGHLIDYDGFGHLVFDDEIEDKKEVSPSDYDSIPEDVTHVLWYNR